MQPIVQKLRIHSMVDRPMFEKLRLTLVAFALCGVFWGGETAQAVRTEGPSQPYVEDAQRYLDAGNIRAAIVQLKNALREDPSNTDARFMLGTIYLGIEDGVSAEKELRSAYNQGLDSDDLRERLGEALLLQGKYQVLLDEIHAEGLDPEQHATVLNLRGRALLGLQDLDGAREAFQSAERVFSEGVNSKLYLARLFIQKKEMPKAAAKIEEALALRPDSELGRVLKGELLRLSGDPEGAIKHFGSALEIKPNSIEASMGRAAALIDLGRDKEAQRDLDRVFHTNARQPLAFHLSAIILARSGELVAADEMLDRGGRTLEGYMPSVYLRGTIAYSRNNLEQAYVHLKRFLEEQSGNVAARRMLGSTLVRQGNYREALVILAPIADSEEHADPQTLALMATANLGAGNRELSARYLERAVAKAPEASQLRTQLALIRLSLGQGGAAIEDLKAAVELSSDAKQPSVLLARLHLASGEYDEALATAQGLLNDNPEDPAFHNLVGAAYFLKASKGARGKDEGGEDLAKANRDAARQAYTKALDLDPGFFPAIQNLAQMDLSEGNAEGAERRFMAVLAKEPRHERAMIALGRLTESLGRNDEAVEWLERTTLVNPESRTPALALMNLYIKLGDPQKALATISQLDQRKPDDPVVVEALAKVQLLSGDESTAVGTYSRLASLVPNDARVYYALGRAQVRARDIFGARTSYRKALELAPDMLPAVLDLINVEIDAERYQAATQLAQALQESHPEHPMGDLLVGHVYGKMGEQDDAMKAFASAEKKVGTTDAILRLYYGYVDIDRRDKAFEAIENWLGGHVDDHPVRRIVATDYLQAGMFQQSLKHYLQLGEVDANNPIILNNMAWLYQITDDDRAIEAAEKAHALLPDAVAVKDTYGWIMVERGDLKKGITLLEEANAMAPDEPEIQYHLALARAKQGRKAEACALLNTALGTDADLLFRSGAEALHKKTACE